MKIFTYEPVNVEMSEAHNMFYSKYKTEKEQTEFVQDKLYALKQMFKVLDDSILINGIILKWYMDYKENKR